MAHEATQAHRHALWQSCLSLPACKALARLLVFGAASPGDTHGVEFESLTLGLFNQPLRREWTHAFAGEPQEVRGFAA
jgi:hypothetical protein